MYLLHFSYKTRKKWAVMVTKYLFCIRCFIHILLLTSHGSNEVNIIYVFKMRKIILWEIFGERGKETMTCDREKGRQWQITIPNSEKFVSWAVVIHEESVYTKVFLSHCFQCSQCFLYLSITNIHQSKLSHSWRCTIMLIIPSL